MPELSIVICTYNREECLSRALESLLGQEDDKGKNYEVLVVDNNSDDCTKKIAERYIEKFHGRLRYLFEPKQGKVHALNQGIKESRGEIIAFMDDDVIIDKFWLNNIYVFSQNNNFDAVGGRVLPVYPPHTPRWIIENKDILSGPIVSHDYGEGIQRYGYSMLPFIGANMIVKRRMFDDAGFFCEALVFGEKVIAEDTEFFRRLEKMGKALYYCGNITVHHPVDQKRMSLVYLANWSIRAGKASAVRDKKEKRVALLFGVPRYLFRELTKSLLAIFVSRYLTSEFLQSWCDTFRDLGMIWEYRKLSLAGEKRGRI